MVSLENQKFLGRQLNNLRKNVPEISGTGEKTGQSARLPALGFAGFILLGGFALLKDIFDFVFVAQLFFKSKWTTASETASVAQKKILIATKKDLDNKIRLVSNEEGKALAMVMDASFLEISCKDDKIKIGAKNSFYILAEKC